MNRMFVLFVLFAANLSASFPIHIFIHACTIGIWEEVLGRQLSRIEESGLYEACDSLSIGVLGTGDMTPFIERYPKITILFQNPDISLFERPTLLSLHSFCSTLTEKSAVLYLHTKGVSGRYGVEDPIQDWAKYMEYFLIDRWRDCIPFLKRYDLCGVNWQKKPPHYSGNFWWAHSDYIIKLPHFIDSGYYAPEFWVASHTKRALCLHQSKIDHYFVRYPEELYIKHQAH